MDNKTYHTFGTIHKMNDDLTNANAEKEKFKKYLEYYMKNTARIAVLKETLCIFVEKPDEYTKIAQYSPHFFNAVMESFSAQIILLLNCFYDQREKYSFKNFFNYVRANHNKIFTGVFFDRVIWDDGSREDYNRITFDWKDVEKAIEESEKSIMENSSTIDKLAILRDKRFAHYDPNFSIIDKIDFCDIQTLFQITENIVNRFIYMFKNEKYLLSPSDADDIKNMVQIIKFYEKHHNEPLLGEQNLFLEK